MYNCWAVRFPTALTVCIIEERKRDSWNASFRTDKGSPLRRIFRCGETLILTFLQWAQYFISRICSTLNTVILILYHQVQAPKMRTNRFTTDDHSKGHWRFPSILLLSFCIVYEMASMFLKWQYPTSSIRWRYISTSTLPRWSQRCTLKYKSGEGFIYKGTVPISRAFRRSTSSVSDCQPRMQRWPAYMR